jgi:predicted ATPase/transcriptional regulator with GAF, ATPase, and Fis domain
MIPGYELIQELSQTEWQKLYRGRRQKDHKTVLIKAPRRDPSSATDLELLEHEYSFLREISIKGILRAHDLLRYDNRCFLILEDHGGGPLLPPQKVGLDEFFGISIQLSAILAELHKLDIIHKNINPRSILLHPSTSEVNLIDFSLASHLSGEKNTPVQHQGLREILPYLSPEQTGRMNRATDHRADFYSLGVTFYKLLTGILPFDSDDALELIHWHLAKIPAPPAEVNPEVPGPISRIVMKLLEKNAEDRYQSATGLKKDLEICAREWSARRFVAPFSLGQSDVSDRFLISQKLYGREAEVRALLEAFDRTCRGNTAMMLVAGYSGIGKTSLIQELYKPIVRERGYFISGKFDQIVRGVPFGALIQAFRGLVRQLLTENEERLGLWRDGLLGALGVNGGVLAEVIPEIELIIGKQSSPPALGPTEALNRFQLVFQNFVSVLASQEHPLVIFLDDLQWADPATLNLLQPLLTSQDIRHLFLMGAYRENEVDAGHPLRRTLRALESSGVELNCINLAPLELPDLTQFICDTLHGHLHETEPLARLVLEKTEGNPFFVIQFLENLKQEGFFEFDDEQGRWIYHLEAIANAPLTDNVVDLMTRKIQRLSPRTQQALMLAACIGNPFDQVTLTAVGRQLTGLSTGDLKEAVKEGLILPARVDRGLRIADHGSKTEGDSQPSVISSQSYVFLHDRVQQAAYALIPAGHKQSVHLTVGRLLFERMKSDEVEEKVFDIVQHLNLGRGLITDEVELTELARLNLSAGQKAKTSTAFEAGLDFLKAGLSLINERHWESDYSLAFTLNLEAAECLYLCGDFDQAEQQFELMLRRATTNLDKARIYGLRIVQYENLSRYGDALACACECLALFGVSFPETDQEKQAALDGEIDSINSLLGNRSTDLLVDLQLMSEPEDRMVMNILMAMWPSAYITGDHVLARLISATMVRLSLVHGNSEESAYGYVTHAITVGPVRGDYQAAYGFGRLALQVNERLNDSKRRAKIHQQFQAHVNLWRQPVSTCIPHAREACRSGLETGDFTYATYGAFTESWAAFLTTQNVAQFAREYSPNLELIRKLQVTNFADAQKIILKWALALQGGTQSPTSLSDDGFDENEYVRNYNDHPFFLMFYFMAKLHLYYLNEEYRNALAAARGARVLAHHLSGTIWPVVLDFWTGLTVAAQSEEDEHEISFRELEMLQASLTVLAENCPENFLCQSLLLTAEIERSAGRDLAAQDFYDRAIHYAEETGMLQYQALANELCGKFWLGRGQARVGAFFITEAAHLYAQWGARAKFEGLKRKYLQQPDGQDDVAGTAATDLDLFSVVKAAQAIAGEIELEKLLGKLLQLTLENAGGERGCLILERHGEFFVHAEGSLDAVEVKIQDAIPLHRMLNLPISLVNYVRRTSESLVLADAKNDDRFGNDPYIRRSHPRSIMCFPVINQGKQVGVLYLENNRASGAFTSDRIKVIQILASQAAVSLENARLFDEMKQEADHRRQAEETLRSIVEGTAAVTGDDFFASLVRHLASALNVRYAFVTECRGETKVKAQTLAFWKGDGLVDNFEYEITETPCLHVLEGEVCYYPQGVQKIYPKDKDLIDLKAESYLGIPMRDTHGEVIGHLAVLDDKPMMQTPRRLSLLKIFAARAGAELERHHAEEELRQALTEVERLKNRLHAENVYLQEEIRREHNFEEIVGGSPALLETLHMIERLAPTDSTALIYGETGTGKELVARAIHSRSPRRDRPLVKVNCGAISAGLVESELFGHVKGAFTGAIDRRTGRFELADGGTLFLDEVGELPLETQVKLLRVLQEGEFEPVGSSKTVRVDVRIIAATNRKLEDAVREGRFRSDLFYRLNVLQLRVPPLRERRSDIPQLVMFFMTRFAKNFGKQIEGVSQETMDLLINYPWPGNVRELQNVIERGVVLSQGSTLILDHDLLPASATGDRAAMFLDGQKVVQTQAGAGTTNEPQSMVEVERQHILATLKQTGWVIEGPHGAARILNLHPNTLRSRMKKLGIHRSQMRSSAED